MPVPLRSKLAGKLRAARLRPTRSRLLVLEAVASNPGRWLNAEEIQQDLTSRKATISLCTIYGAVKELQNHGLLLRECHDSLNGGRAVYILNPKDDKRTSSDPVCIVCRKCRTCTFIHAPEVWNQLRILAACQFANSFDQHISVFVTCDQCAGSRDSTEPTNPFVATDRPQCLST